MPETIQSFQPLKRENVVGDIIEAFKQAIIQGELKPGQRVPSETELREQFGVGRGAIREAMKVLEATGVVNIKQGNGTYIVDEPSPALFNPLAFAIMLEADMGQELLELRSLIQVGYCRLVAIHAMEDDWNKLNEAEGAFKTYARSPQRDVDELTKLDLDFHKALLGATHNPLVIKIGQTVEEIFFASIRATLSKMGDLEWAIESHEQIIKAIKSGDQENICNVVVASLAHWGEEIIRREQGS